MLRLLLAVASLSAATAVAAGPVYKCVGADGKTTFADRPCSGDAEELNVKDNRIGGSFSPSEEWLEHNERSRKTAEINRRYDAALRQIEKGPCKDFSSTQLRSMIIANGVVPGMSVSDALRSWGQPTRVNGSQYAYHWNKGGSSYFYVSNGCVRNIQGSYNG